MSKRLDAKRAEKANRKERALALEQRREAIRKAIARHKRKQSGGEHAFAKWGKTMSILRAIHKEIKPLLEQKRDAERFLCSGKIYV